MSSWIHAQRQRRLSSVSCIPSDKTEYFIGNKRVSKCYFQSQRDVHRIKRRIPSFATSPTESNFTPRRTPIDNMDTVVSLFNKIVKQYPDNIAIEDETNCSYTYKELNDSANRIANKIKSIYKEKNQSCIDVPVGVCVNRSCNMVIAMLGILKSGAGYVPLDPSFPANRLGWYSYDSGLSVIITEKNLEDFVNTLKDDEAQDISDRTILFVENLLDDSISSEEPMLISDNETLVYMIYTSGSTGKPKGVMLEHKSVVNFLNSFRNYPGINQSDTVVGVTTICFDIHVAEIWLPLTTGAKVIITKKQTSIDGYALQKLFMERNATFFQATPSTYRILLECGWKGNENLKCICGGEPLPVSLCRELVPIIKSLYNAYGPTETTVYSTVFRVTEEYLLENPTNILIGTTNSVENTTIYILDPESKQMLNNGEVGAIYIGGLGMARGYKNREQLTAEKWIPDNFTNDLGGEMYFTGDLGKITKDGYVECLGRIDNQVKINGYRIELGEIESEIDKLPEIKGVVVLVQENPTGEKQLVGYIVHSKPENEIDCAKIQNALSGPLPNYMIPKTWIPLESLPLLPNGKIDRNSLPEPDWETIGNSSCDIEQPNTETEKILFEFVNELLPSSIGISDNFFVNGGNSLFAVRLFNMITDNEKFHNIDLEINQIFRSPTIKSLAGIIDGKSEVTYKLEGFAKQCIVPLQVEGNLQPLFIVHPAGGLVFPYFQLASKLAPEQPLFALQDPHVDNDDPLPSDASVESIAKDYLQAIKCIQPKGPYLLAGWSFGGNIAYEMAQQSLNEDGELSTVILLDSDFSEKFEALKAFRNNLIGSLRNGLVSAGIEVQHQKFKEEIERGKEEHRFLVKARVAAAFTHAALVAVEKIKIHDNRDVERIDKQKLDEETKQIAKDFYDIVKVKDRKFRLTTYKRCFTGKGAVDALVENNIATDRKHAVEIGQRMLDAGVFHHVLGDHDFKDAHLFYRFRVDEHKDKFQTNTIIDNDIAELAERMHTELDIKDRKYRFKNYKSCFTGSHCVAWLLENKIVDTEKQAISLGNRLIDEGIIIHVTKDHRFENKNYFYKFVKQKVTSNQNSPVLPGAVTEGFSDIKTPQATRLLHLLDWHFKIGSKYTPQPYEGRVSLIRCTRPLKPERYEGWFNVCSFLTVTDIDANHYNVVSDPHVGILADAIRGLVQESSEFC